MRTLTLLLLALVPIAGTAIAPAAAAPLPRLDGAAVADQILPVEKVHGWHGYCARGPVHLHRHVPGYGNVACGAPRYGGYGFYGPSVRTWRWSAPRYHWRHHHGHYRRWR